MFTLLNSVLCIIIVILLCKLRRDIQEIDCPGYQARKKK